MTKIDKLDKIPHNLNMMAGIDIIGNFCHLFGESSKVPGYLFILCIQGSCVVNVHVNQYNIKKGSLIIVLPDLYFKITEQTDDCRFIFVGYETEMVRSSDLFSKAVEFTPYIFENPVLQLNNKGYDLLFNYIMLIIKAKNVSQNVFNKDQVYLSFTQLILGLGSLIREKKGSYQQYTRNQEIMKKLIKTVITNYQSERNIAFYSKKLNLSPQYLSTTIKKMTGKTLTDIISSFIINDAKAKLMSTDKPIQDIAWSLGFYDMSFFGKYFKRHTGMSPKQYRKTSRE